MVRRVLAGVAILATVAACGGGGKGPTVESATKDVVTSAPATPSSSSSAPSSTTTTPSGVTAGIKTGQCLLDNKQYQVVPCTQSHTYQVTAVISDKRSADDPTERQALRQETCNASLAQYTGAAPVGLLVVGNPVALADDPQNASRIVCTAHMRTSDDSANLPVTFSFQNKFKGKASFAYTYCVDKVAPGYRIVSCSSPHQGQTTGGYLAGRYVEKFPGKPRFQQLFNQTCKPQAYSFLSTRVRKDIAISGLYVTASAWSQGNRYGGCFIRVTSGTVKKSLQGIGAKPLTSYR